MALELITCAEMVAIAYAQSQAFTWTQFWGLHLTQSRKNKKGCKDCCLIVAFRALSQTGDVLDDARNTFINVNEQEAKERETQLDELMRGGRAF